MSLTTGQGKFYYPGVTDGPPVSAELGAMMQSVDDFLGDRGSIGQNLIINGDFRINQRGYVSATDLASGAYGLDRWKATTATSRMTFTAAPQGQTVTIAAGDSFGQVVERANIQASDHTLSWSGTAQARVYNVGDSAPSYADSPVTVALDGTADVLVEFGPGTVGNVKLERGSVATPFQTPDYGEELAKCQRYYQQFGAESSTDRYGQGSATSTTLVVVTVPLLAPMRIASPTLTYNTLRVSDGVNAHVVSAALLNTPGTNVHNIALTVSGATQYRPYMLIANGTGSFIAFDAEL